jgi:hypothetical protein
MYLNRYGAKIVKINNKGSILVGPHQIGIDITNSTFAATNSQPFLEK